MEAELRKTIVDVCRWMHERGFIAAKDGNVSARLDDSTLLVTPSGVRKGYLEPSQLMLTDLEGNCTKKTDDMPSSEIGLHLAVYRVRSDVQAVVHAHPPVAIAHTLAGVSLSTPLMPEVVVELGDVVTVPYTTPGTASVGAAIEVAIRGRKALMMERHGSVTVGRDVLEAYDRLEILEHTARISMAARTLGGGSVEGLSKAALSELMGGSQS